MSRQACVLTLLVCELRARAPPDASAALPPRRRGALRRESRTDTSRRSVLRDIAYKTPVRFAYTYVRTHSSASLQFGAMSSI